MFETFSFVSQPFTFPGAIAMVLIAAVLGLIISFTYMKTSSFYSKNFAVSLIVIPALISTVIALICGNTTASLATIGAFALIRFRSIQGTSKDLAYILFTVTLGLACGMGYIPFAIALTVLISFIMFVLYFVDYGQPKTEKKELRITIPENLDFSDVFDEIFAQYTASTELISVKTTNLGSMYELQYHIVEKDSKKEKEMIDAIRVKNGNLNIVCGKMNYQKDSL